ncbi:MAG: hypothetical protein JWR52_2874 [Marmoricola sp.]|nr:hypothetical protein [Marmoricola sp.]
MKVITPDGKHVEVARRWLPWNLRKRDFGNPFGNPLGLLDGADDLAGAAVALVMGIVLVLFGGVILTFTILAGEAVLLLLLLIPLYFAARTFWVLPWIIEAKAGNQVLAQEKVRGWRESDAHIREIAGRLERGELQVPRGVQYGA